MLKEFKYSILLLILQLVQKGWALECPPAEEILPCRCLVKNGDYQVWCSHSDLPKITEGLQALRSHVTTPIDELILENNYLPSLPGRFFYSLKIIRLMLRYNNVERVSTDWLGGLEPTLMELFLVEPKLRYLPDDSLGQLNSLEAITIQTRDLKRLPQIVSLENLRYIQVESKSLIELSSRNFKNLPALEKFHLSGSPNLIRLEANLFKDLQALKSVNVSNCGINWVHPRTFFNLPMMKEVVLVGNKITDAGMVGRASKDLTSLEVLRLDDNYIRKLTEGSFVDLPSLKMLYLTNNNIGEIHHGAFHRVPSLRSLFLSKNNIRKIHPESFLQQSGSGLQELWLVHNDISHVSELKSLLDALPRLTFLDMSYNKLEVIPFGAIRGHSTLEVLKINYNNLFQIDKEAFMAMPSLRELGLRNNSLSDEMVPLWNLPSLKGLDVSNNFYRRLSPTFLENLPSLRRINLSGNELIMLDPLTFMLTPQLEYINISRNALQILHPGLFQNLNNLYELDLSFNNLLEFVSDLPEEMEHLHLGHNKIKLIPFVYLKKQLLLRTLDLGHNVVEHVPPHSFTIFSKLRKLSLRNNYLHNLEEASLSGLANLEHLNLGGNRIIHIHPNALKDLNKLTELNLGTNSLETILPGLLNNTPKLKILNLSQNRLTDFIQGTLDGVKDLQFLNLSNNYLISLPKSLFTKRKLKILDLSHNRLRNVAPNTFNNLMSLRMLDLSQNVIQEIKMKSFQNLKFLTMLYLDNNDIVNIETNSIQNLPNLKKLKLQRNKLTNLPSFTFHNLTRLEMVQLEENRLNSISYNAFNLVPNLLMLNLSSNNLRSLDEAGLRGIRSLEMLDVGHNQITRITSNSLKNMEWMVELRLDHNEICGFSGAPFNDMPRLRVISMRDNNIKSLPETILDKIRSNVAVFDLDGNPLDCGCNLQWLQAWTLESASVGPRCVDGTLLRVVSLVKEVCNQVQEYDYSLSNCPGENSPPHYDTSQVSAQLLRNGSDSLGKPSQNHLAPSPEESDYFYDEYVYYPMNDTSDQGNKKQAIGEAKLPNIEFIPALNATNVSSHYISGDTPTLYAATSNKSKPDIPKEVPNSPSSSGFTFFGVPLPSLNLNQIISAVHPSAKNVDAKQIADRKSAIVNNPPILPSFSNSRGTAGTVIFPTNLEVQKGGFKPLLPGSGGFKPMNPQGAVIKVTGDEILNVAAVPRLGTAQKEAVTATPVFTTASTSVLAKPTATTPTYVPKKETTTVLSSVKKSTASTTPFPDIVTTQVDYQDSTDFEITYDDLAKEQSHSPLVQARNASQKNVLSNLSDQVVPQQNVNSRKDILFTPKPALVPSRTDLMEKKGTPLTGLLVPGGQQPLNKTSVGKSTITKVMSPHFSTTEATPVEKTKRENISPPKKEDMKDWYFANYNKTVPEPYVGRIANSSSGNILLFYLFGIVLPLFYFI